MRSTHGLISLLQLTLDNIAVKNDLVIFYVVLYILLEAFQSIPWSYIGLILGLMQLGVMDLQQSLTQELIVLF